MNLTIQSEQAVDLRAIDLNGFVVIRDFLDKEEINTIVNDYNESKSRAKNANYPISYAGQEVFNLLQDKILSLSESVGKVTSSHVDTDQGSIYFSINRGINFGWHQDHESFFMNQNHIDYLNFYMIIIKEKREEANLNVVPFARLKAKSPEYYNMLVGSGANRYEIKDGQTHIYSDETGKKIGVIPYDLATLAETPKLNVGDLLLLRGDSIHSTQPSDSARVALSVRMVNSKNRLSLKRMVKGAKAKMVTMTKNRHTYAKIFNAFQRLGAVETTYSTLIHEIGLDKSLAPSKYKFMFRLFKLRLRLMFS